MNSLLTGLVIGLGLAVALLALLVAGLLRSHAEILRSLHELGAGREDTASRTGPVDLPFGAEPGVVGPAGLTGAAAPDVSGSSPGGDSLQVSVTASGQHTLLAFLSSGCLTCHGFWDRFRDPASLALPRGTRLVVVTQGPERESASAVATLASDDLVVVMSTSTWEGYEVPGSPYFVLVPGGAFSSSRHRSASVSMEGDCGVTGRTDPEHRRPMALPCVRRRAPAPPRPAGVSFHPPPPSTSAAAVFGAHRVGDPRAIRHRRSTPRDESLRLNRVGAAGSITLRRALAAHFAEAAGHALNGTR
ncbi:MAG: hypothetical protein ACRYF3_07660 [Janthinobacterium lividum]